MKITSRASDYALLLLMYLANLPEDKMASVKKISAHHNLSLRFLANIANKLAIARIVSSYRGVGGGIKLRRPSHEISICDVIEAVDGPIQTMFCQNTQELCSHEVLCQMKHFWDGIQTDMVNKLNQKTIGDLVTPITPSGPTNVPGDLGTAIAV